MAVVRVRSSHTSASTAASVTLADMTNTAGNFLIAKIGWQGGAISISGVSDTANGAWTLLTPRTDEASAKACIAYRENIAGATASNDITATLSGTSDFVNIQVVEYSGVRTSGSFDVEASGSSGGGGGNTFTTGNMVVTDGGLLFYGTELFSVGENIVPGTTNSQTWQEIIDTSTYSVAELLNIPTGTYIGTASRTSTANWCMVAAAFKATEVVVDLGAFIGEPQAGGGVIN